MAELAKAYVQIIPSARGMTDGIKNELSGAGGAGGASAGAKFWTFFKKALPVAAIGKLVKDTLDVGSAYEQSAGGIKKIFEGATDAVLQNAGKAWQTAGMSAADYTERVTSFGVALVKATGDAQVAARLADQTMRDMADNSAMFGTSIIDINNAYQGFSKMNYTMLDNLKLGYGGTKTEMERLLADAEELSGIKYDINNLADVQNAIHVIQKELNITGTAANEAKTTFSGAFAAMTAAGNNFMTTLFMGDGVAEALSNMLESVGTFGGILGQRLMLIIDGLAVSLPELIPGLITGLVKALTAGVPAIASAGIQLFTGLIKNLPEIIMAIIKAVPEIIKALIETFLTFLASIAEVGVSLISWLIKGISGKKGDVEGEGDNMANALLNALSNAWENLKQAGRDIVIKIIEGIAEEWENLKGWFNDLVNKLFGDVRVNVRVAKYGPGQGDSGGGGKGFRTGLAYVPYDEFPAILHKGERVLTAQENAEYNSGGMNNAAVVELLEGILTAVSNRGESTVTLNIDKRELGRAVLAVV